MIERSQAEVSNKKSALLESIQHLATERTSNS